MLDNIRDRISQPLSGFTKAHRMIMNSWAAPADPISGDEEIVRRTSPAQPFVARKAIKSGRQQQA